MQLQNQDNIYSLLCMYLNTEQISKLATIYTYSQNFLRDETFTNFASSIMKLL